MRHHAGYTGERPPRASVHAFFSAWPDASPAKTIGHFAALGRRHKRAPPDNRVARAATASAPSRCGTGGSCQIHRAAEPLPPCQVGSQQFMVGGDLIDGVVAQRQPQRRLRAVTCVPRNSGALETEPGRSCRSGGCMPPAIANRLEKRMLVGSVVV